MNRLLLLTLAAAALACAPDPATTDFDRLDRGFEPGDAVEVMLSGASNGGGVPLSVTGSLVAISGDWIVVDTDYERNWVARESVARIRQSLK